MNSIIKSINGCIADLNAAGILTFRNFIIAYVISLVLVIIPIRGIRKLGGLLMVALTLGALLVWLLKLAELTA